MPTLKAEHGGGSRRIAFDFGLIGASARWA